MPILLTNPPLAVLAQAGSAADHTGEIYFWLGVIIVAALVLVVLGVVLRKWLFDQEEAGQSVGFSLSDLRRLHREGELNDAQYETARKALIAQGMAVLNTGSEGEDQADTPESLSRQRVQPLDENEPSPDPADEDPAGPGNTPQDPDRPPDHSPDRSPDDPDSDKNPGDAPEDRDP